MAMFQTENFRPCIIPQKSMHFHSRQPPLPRRFFWDPWQSCPNSVWLLDLRQLGKFSQVHRSYCFQPSGVTFFRSFFKDGKLSRLFILHVLPHNFQKSMGEFENDITMNTYWEWQWINRRNTHVMILWIICFFNFNLIKSQRHQHFHNHLYQKNLRSALAKVSRPPWRPPKKAAPSWCWKPAERDEWKPLIRTPHRRIFMWNPDRILKGECIGQRLFWELQQRTNKLRRLVRIWCHQKTPVEEPFHVLEFEWKKSQWGWHHLSSNFCFIFSTWGCPTPVCL